MTHDCWNDFTKTWHRKLPSSPTLHALRDPAKYHVVADPQLKRDLKGRTIKDVYRDNKVGRVVSWRANDPAANAERQKAEYLAWCKSRKHKPHPASIDPRHPIAQQRETVPRAEKVNP